MPDAGGFRSSARSRFASRLGRAGRRGLRRPGWLVLEVHPPGPIQDQDVVAFLPRFDPVEEPLLDGVSREARRRGSRDPRGRRSQDPGHARFPAAGALFLQLLPAGEDRAADADGRPGQHPEDGAGRGPHRPLLLPLPALFSDEVHRGLELQVPHRVDDVDLLVGVAGVADHLLVEVPEVPLGVLVLSDLHERDGERTRLHPAAVGDRLGGVPEGFLQELGVVRLAGRQNQDRAGSLSLLGVDVLAEGLAEDGVHGFPQGAAPPRIAGGDLFLDGGRVRDVPEGLDGTVGISISISISIVVVVPREIPVNALPRPAADADDVDAVGIEPVDGVHQRIRGDDGLFPSGGVGSVVKDLRHGHGREARDR
mmetsp:Transcript_23356/g.55270  ORF Transcript_23356/g.55270 Transcript_23356/m.55270 type:complete len:367 (+) Transcript_23356:272-1372(+)